MTGQPPSAPGGPTGAAKVFGYLLVFLGVVWTVLSGGCTLVFMSMAAGSLGRGGNAQSVVVFLGIGAVCILPGLVCLWAGWLILRKPRPPQPPVS
jgi:hypothetical protein